MAIVNFEDQINCQLVVEPYISGDSAGARIYGGPQTFDAIQQGPSARSFLINGETIFDRAVVYVGPEMAELDPRSRITITGGTAPGGPTPPRLLDVDSMTLNGELYYWRIHIA